MLYDISPPLSPGLPVWPGDVPLSREVQCRVEAGDVATLSALRSTAHLGAHADAPSHVLTGGRTIDQCDLGIYVGSCEVVRVAVPPGGVVTPGALPERLRAPRLLLARAAAGTAEGDDAPAFRPDYVALSVSLADWLAEQQVRLVGVDSPSVDRFSDGDLPVHRRLVARGVAILEGLSLADVPAGVYELIALPLRLVGFEASPVRAILRELAG